MFFVRYRYIILFILFYLDFIKILLRRGYYYYCFFIESQAVLVSDLKFEINVLTKFEVVLGVYIKFNIREVKDGVDICLYLVKIFWLDIEFECFGEVCLRLIDCWRRSFVGWEEVGRGRKRMIFVLKNRMRFSYSIRNQIYVIFLRFVFFYCIYLKSRK